jgi:putative transposase
LFWVLARRFWPQWKNMLVIVLPETVARWHRAGFKLYWSMLCKVRNRVGGGRRISKEIRQLIFQIVAENPSWGAPRIHGELLMLGFEVSEATISRWMRRAPRVPDPAKRWLAFVRNHREANAAMDFFTVPTLTFRAQLNVEDPGPGSPGYCLQSFFVDSPCDLGSTATTRRVAEKWSI